MSVMFFDLPELANLVAAVPPQHREATARILSKVSQANASAYVHTYPGEPIEVEPATVNDLLLVADDITLNPKLAIRTLELLHYNTIANDGRSFLDDDTVERLHVVRRLFVAAR